MTWTPHEDGEAASAAGSAPVISYIQPAESPPEYTVARRPTEPVLYSFSRVSPNAMLLIPPSHAPDTRPLYHISVNLNCFNPLSAITCIRRGATEYGEYVGDFELGISSQPATICFRDREFLMSSLITKLGSREGCVWHWMSNSPTHAVRWDTRPSPAVCSTGLPSNPPLAKFYPSAGLRRPSTPAPISRLQVMPQGHERLDDILISLLIIERKRLTPSGSDYRTLFS
ncbi:hypothetical protein L208DRAFT_738500 [Tricholoma matsutake]|nr:hypothetical protein L208DRAFT_738500 [Tricholoma matsutake 945]